MSFDTLTQTGLSSMCIDHVMLGVPNYEKTMRWYQEKLDATVEQEWTVQELPDLKFAYLNVHGFHIEVVGSSESRPGMPSLFDFGEALRTTGIGHFCFRVNDVDAALAELNHRGVQTFVEPADYPSVGVRVGFIKDNNGNVIEFTGPLTATHLSPTT